MASTAILNTVYNYYLTTYSPKGSSPYDSHKKDELKNVCNTITKLNKEAPLYLLKNVRATSAYAVQMKENARSLGNTIASLSGLEDGELLNKKAAFSSDEALATATFIGSSRAAAHSPSFELQVESLASSQVNLGYFLPKEKVSIAPDTYSFDIMVNDLNYEFQYNINENETNQDIQNRLARLINNAGIGLNADVVENEDGLTGLRLKSVATGVPSDGDLLFQISDNNTSKRNGSVEYLGLDYVARKPEDALFTLNGEKRSSGSNTFVVGNQFQVTLHNTSVDGAIANIGLKTDVESLTDNISTLVRGYNSFLKTAGEFNETGTDNNRLIREMKSLTSHYQAQLEATGLHIGDDGTIEISKDQLRETALADNASESFEGIKQFTHSLVRKTGQISINPMQYTDRTVVAYKNPGHNFTNPYVTSPYTGMMFNSYC
ncbi:MAG: flagellar filament capping protein FliD [Lachnospiraceae bacterium]|nr:flagellar filament capping protein FliD [Lachnospiraceae bacterium]